MTANPMLSPLCRALVTAGCMWAVAAQAADATDVADFASADLSIEELLKTDVSSVSRKTQRLWESAAAVFVITNEDIHRSGATSIPEALRLVPGMQVAALDNSRWAVSARGFNGRFANKLLVLMDGRSVYSPLFSGVFWEQQNLILEDVERIEVIRGPGAAMWGANAVNGVINIITKKARDTQGGLLVGAAGTELRGMAGARWGGRTEDDTSYRVWTKALIRDNSNDTRNADSGRVSHAGFRLDKSLGEGSRFSASGDVFVSVIRDQWIRPDLNQAPSYQSLVVDDDRQHGFHLQGRYDWVGADGAEMSLQGYLEREQINAPMIMGDDRVTADLDFQRRRVYGAHDTIVGLGYRQSRDHATISTPAFRVEPTYRTARLFNAFVHDEWTLLPDRLRLIAGTKVEHNSFTGWEWEPNLRMLWTPSANDTVWGAISRAVRTPSRAEVDVNLQLETIQVGDPRNTSQIRVPVLVTAQGIGEDRAKSEKVTSYELGWRRQFSPTLSADLTTYVTEYDDLRTGRITGTDCLYSFGFGSCNLAFLGFTPTLVRTSTETLMTASARGHGVELAGDWRAAPWLRLQLAYTWAHLHINNPSAGGSADFALGNLPQSTLSLRGFINLPGNVQIDPWFRHVSTMPSQNIKAYSEMDLRLAWRASPSLELSLVGQNLLHARHQEFVSEFVPTIPLSVERGFYAKARWSF